jgi:DNA processing protein
MARGVDTAAHQGAVSAKKKTIAVFGTGGDVTYPKENTRTGRTNSRARGSCDLRISGGHVPDAAEPSDPQPHHKRHAGDVPGVEAVEYNDPPIASRCTLEQNRDAYADPGNVTNKNAWGPTL